jgi:hypothetical protein
VVLDRARADEQLSGDLSVRISLCHEARDLRLLRSQLAERVHRPVAGMLPCRRELESSAFGERLHPELDAMFIAKPDKSVELTVTAKSLKAAWDEINQKLWEGYSEFSAEAWAGRHTAVSEEDFEREPHRNRFTVLLGRTAHLAYHVGQAALARPNA